MTNPMNGILTGVVHVDNEAIKYLNQYLNKCQFCKKAATFKYKPLYREVFIECSCETEECRPMYFGLDNALIGLLGDFLMNDFIKRWNTRTGEK